MLCMDSFSLLCEKRDVSTNVLPQNIHKQKEIASFPNCPVYVGKQCQSGAEGKGQVGTQSVATTDIFSHLFLQGREKDLFISNVN